MSDYKLLWKAYSYAIDWIKWSSNETKYNTFERSEQWQTILFYPFNFGQSFNSSFAFHLRYIERNDSFTEIGFIGQTYYQTIGVFERQWNFFRLSSDGMSVFRINSDLNKMMMVDNLKIIDISSSYMTDQYNQVQLNYVILFKVNNKILYLRTSILREEIN